MCVTEISSAICYNLHDTPGTFCYNGGEVPPQGGFSRAIPIPAGAVPASDAFPDFVGCTRNVRLTRCARRGYSGCCRTVRAAGVERCHTQRHGACAPAVHWQQSRVAHGDGSRRNGGQRRADDGAGEWRESQHQPQQRDGRNPPDAGRRDGQHGAGDGAQAAADGRRVPHCTGKKTAKRLPR